MQKLEFDDVNRPIDKQEMRTLVPYSDSQISRFEKRGEFPKRTHLGLRKVSWNLSEVTNWRQQKMKANPINPTLKPLNLKGTAK